jgi:hypothetical protein
LLEPDRVDGHLGVREQPDEVVAQDDGVIAAGGTAGEVGGLVKARRRPLGRLARPQQIHHPLTMEPMTGGEGKDLDEGRGAAPRPTSAGRRQTVDGDAEAAEHRDLDRGVFAPLESSVVAMCDLGGWLVMALHEISSGV